MCFSEKASFTAAVILTLISLPSFRIASKTPERYALAAIPLFFGLQQAAEGVEWLHFKGLWGSAQTAEAARDLFLLIAYVLWPIWIPLSLWLAERQRTKPFLTALLLGGTTLASYNAWHLLALPVSAQAIHNSIQYNVSTFDNEIFVYAAVVTIPWFFSSLEGTKPQGLLIAFGLFIAYWIYTSTMASVWCFFSACVSIMIFYVLRANQERTGRVRMKDDG